jgi:hypothetical protein
MKEVRRLAARILFLVLIITFGFSASLFANPILYTFSTTGGVAGSFILDDSTPFGISGQGLFSIGFSPPTPYVIYRASSPLITGTYGAYSFSGVGGCSGITCSLEVIDFQPPYGAALDEGQLDSWIERAIVSGPVLNGRSVTGLAIFEYVHPATLNGPTFTPPPPFHDPQDFKFAVIFSDGTSETGQLASLTLVPEPSSVLLLGFGLVGIIALKIRKFSKLKSCTQL